MDTNGKQLLGPDGLPFFRDRNSRLDAEQPGFPVPHVLTFAGLLQGASKTYFREIWDEAMKHSRENALAMRRDEHLQACLRERKRATTSLKWHIESDNPKDPWQKAVCTGVERIVRATPHLRKLMKVLKEDLWYGRYGIQEKWKWKKIQVPVPSAGGMSQEQTIDGLHLVDWIPLNGDKIDYKWDGTPTVRLYGGRTEQFPQGDTLVDNLGYSLVLNEKYRELFLISTWEVDDADFFEPERASVVHGLGIRDWLYWSWWTKNEYMTAVVDGLERFGLGFIIINYDASNDLARQEAEKVGKNYSRRSVLLIPKDPATMKSGSGVEVVQTPVAGMEVLLMLQQACEARQERFIIGQSMSSSPKGSSSLGGGGPADFERETKWDIVEEDSQGLAETLTGSDKEPGLISVIKKWTYPWADFPLRWVFQLDPNEAEKKMGVISAAFNMGMKVPESELQQLASVSAGDTDEKMLQNPAFAQLEMQQAQMQAGQVPGMAPGSTPGLGGEDGESGGGGSPAPTQPSGGSGDPVFDKMLQGQPKEEGQGAPQEAGGEDNDDISEEDEKNAWDQLEKLDSEKNGVQHASESNQVQYGLLGAIGGGIKAAVEKAKSHGESLSKRPTLATNLGAAIGQTARNVGERTAGVGDFIKKELDLPGITSESVSTEKKPEPIKEPTESEIQRKARGPRFDEPDKMEELRLSTHPITKAVVSLAALPVTGPVTAARLISRTIKTAQQHGIDAALAKVPPRFKAMFTDLLSDERHTKHVQNHLDSLYADNRAIRQQLQEMHRDDEAVKYGIFGGLKKAVGKIDTAANNAGLAIDEHGLGGAAMKGLGKIFKAGQNAMLKPPEAMPVKPYDAKLAENPALAHEEWKKIATEQALEHNKKNAGNPNAVLKSIPVPTPTNAAPVANKTPVAQAKGNVVINRKSPPPPYNIPTEAIPLQGKQPPPAAIPVPPMATPVAQAKPSAPTEPQQVTEKPPATPPSAPAENTPDNPPPIRGRGMNAPAGAIEKALGGIGKTPLPGRTEYPVSEPAPQTEGRVPTAEPIDESEPKKGNARKALFNLIHKFPGRSIGEYTDSLKQQGWEDDDVHAASFALANSKRFSQRGEGWHPVDPFAKQAAPQASGTAAPAGPEMANNAEISSSTKQPLQKAALPPAVQQLLDSGQITEAEAGALNEQIQQSAAKGGVKTIQPTVSKDEIEPPKPFTVPKEEPKPEPAKEPQPAATEPVAGETSNPSKQIGKSRLSESDMQKVVGMFPDVPESEIHSIIDNTSKEEANRLFTSYSDEAQKLLKSGANSGNKEFQAAQQKASLYFWLATQPDKTTLGQGPSTTQPVAPPMPDKPKGVPVRARLKEDQAGKSSAAVNPSEFRKPEVADAARQSHEEGALHPSPLDRPKPEKSLFPPETRTQPVEEQAATEPPVEQPEQPAAPVAPTPKPTMEQVDSAIKEFLSGNPRDRFGPKMVAQELSQILGQPVDSRVVRARMDELAGKGEIHAAKGNKWSAHNTKDLPRNPYFKELADQLALPENGGHHPQDLLNAAEHIKAEHDLGADKHNAILTDLFNSGLSKLLGAKTVKGMMNEIQKIAGEGHDYAWLNTDNLAGSGPVGSVRRMAGSKKDVSRMQEYKKTLGFDEIAEKFVQDHAPELANRTGGAEQALWEVLNEGMKEKLPEEKAWNEAFERLQDSKPSEGPQPEGEIPFQSGKKPVQYGLEGEITPQATPKWHEHPHFSMGKDYHAKQMAKIPVGEIGHAWGFPVRRHGIDEYHLETDEGPVKASAEHLSHGLAHAWDAHKLYGKQVGAALARAEAHNEPDPFEENERHVEEGQKFSQLPHGTPIVSLHPKTYGRLGEIVHEPDQMTGQKRVRVKLEGTPHWENGHVEPLDEKLSWRAKQPIEPPPPEPEQGSLFSGGDKVKKSKPFFLAPKAQATPMTQQETDEFFETKPEQGNLFSQLGKKPVQPVQEKPEQGTLFQRLTSAIQYAIDNGEDTEEAIAYQDLCDRIEQARKETDCDPSEDQKKAGNYRKGKVMMHGMEISIENPKGSTRSGKSKDGKEWSIEMAHDYGYIRKTESEADGDHVDVFIGPDPESQIVFVIDQQSPKGRFDEHKCMLGFHNEQDAKQGYLDCYSSGWKGFGGMAMMLMPQFKEWIANGETGKRAVDQVDYQDDVVDYARQGLSNPAHAGSFAKAGEGVEIPSLEKPAVPEVPKVPAPQPPQLGGGNLSPVAAAKSALQQPSDMMPTRKLVPPPQAGQLKAHLPKIAGDSQAVADILHSGQFPWHLATPEDHAAMQQHLGDIGKQDPGKFWEIAQSAGHGLHAAGEQPHVEHARDLLHSVAAKLPEGPQVPLDEQNKAKAVFLDDAKLNTPAWKQAAKEALKGLPKVEGQENGYYVPEGFNVKKFLGPNYPVDVQGEGAPADETRKPREGEPGWGDLHKETALGIRQRFDLPKRPTANRPEGSEAAPMTPEQEEEAQAETLASHDRNRMKVSHLPAPEDVLANEVPAVTKHRDSSGGNAFTYNAHFPSGHKAKFKKPEEEIDNRPGLIPRGEAYKREAAVSDIAEELGFGDLVPRTIIRDIPGHGVGSMQGWVPGKENGREAQTAARTSEDRYDGPKDLARAALFDYLIGSTDRHTQNWMIGGGKSKLALIDNGYALPQENSYLDSALFKAATDKGLKAPDVTKDWTDDKFFGLAKKLKAQGIDDKSLDAMRQRWNWILEAQRKGEFGFDKLRKLI